MKFKFRFLLAVFILFYFTSVAYATIFVQQGESFEVKSKPLTASRTSCRFIIHSHTDLRKVQKIGAVSIDKDGQYRTIVNTQKWQPGEYDLRFLDNKRTKYQRIVVLPPVRAGNPRLAGILKQLVFINSLKRPGVLKEFADARGIPMNPDTLWVDIEIKMSQSNLSHVQNLTKNIGGEISSYYENLVSARVPLANLEKAGEDPNVLFVHPLEKVVRDDGNICSEGVADIGADLWQMAGYDGTGVKIAILDSFKYYKLYQMLGELPLKLQAKIFGAQSVEDGGGHGSACAGIVYDLAPGATYYLINCHSNAAFLNVVDYCIQEKVDVISHSVSNFRGPMNGKSRRAQKINQAAEAGILWVNSAGNYAQSHWEGYFKDNGEGIHVWENGKTRKNLNLKKGNFEDIWLIWDDWGKDQAGFPSGNATGQDFCINVYKDGVLMETADDNQNKNSYADPYEYEAFKVQEEGTYEVEVKRVAGSGEPKYLELFVAGPDIENPVSSGSQSIGGDAEKAISVGAVQHTTHELMPYSSRGPTNGKNGGAPDETSLIKPDVSGPTKVKAIYYSSGFGGTSASTPHIAGAAALVKQYLEKKNGSASSDDVKKYLFQHVDLLGYPAPKNNEVGYGFLQLGTGEVFAEICPEILSVKGAYYINGTLDVMVHFKNILPDFQVDFGQGIIVNSKTLVKDGPYTGYYIFNVSILPEAKEGARKVIISNPNGKSANFDFFILSAGKKMEGSIKVSPYKVPGGWEGKLIISSLDPSTVIFAEGANLNIDFVKIKGIKIISPQQLEVEVKVFADAFGDCTVIIQNPDGTWTGASLGNNLYIVPKPYFGSLPVFPREGPQGWSGEVTITGPWVKDNQNFQKGAAVLFGEGIMVNSFEVVNAITIKANISVANDAMSGIRPLTVINPDGGVGTKEAGFYVLPKPMLSISEVKALGYWDYAPPLKLPVGFKSKIRIIGANISENAKVVIGDGVEVTNYDYSGIEKGYLDVVFGVGLSAPLGPKNVTVINSDGSSDVKEAAFEVVPQGEGVGPQIDAIVPTKVKQNATTPIGFYGKSFYGKGMTVEAGAGIAPETVDYATDCEFVVDLSVSEDAPLGLRDITLTCPDGTMCIAKGILEILPKDEIPKVAITQVVPNKFLQGEYAKLVTIEGANFSLLVDEEGKKEPQISFGDGTWWGGIVSNITNDKIQGLLTTNFKAALGPRTLEIKNAQGVSVAKLENAIEIISLLGIKSVSPGILYAGDDLVLSLEIEGLDGPLISPPAIEFPYSWGINVVSDPVVYANKIDFPIRVDVGAFMVPGYDAADVKLVLGNKIIEAPKIIQIKKPSLTGFFPSYGKQGETIEIEIIGEGSHFGKGGKSTEVCLTSHWGGEDLPPEGWVGDISTASNVQVLSPTKIKATFKIAENAFLSKRNVGVSTPDINGTGKAEVLWLNESFEVMPK